LNTDERIEAYFRYCIDLIQSVQKDGVVSRASLGIFGRIWLDHRGARPLALDSVERDVGVAITESGRLVRHLGGKHRTAVAHALGLSQMPVELRLVHVGWLRREMERTGLPAHLALQKALDFPRGLIVETTLPVGLDLYAKKKA